MDETLYLTGRPTLRGFVRFVRGRAQSPPGEGALSEEWLEARDHIRRLEASEAGLANDPSILQMGPSYEPLLIEFLKDPLVRHGFNTVPTDVVLVELERLVVHQKHIDLSFVRELERKLGPDPSVADVFRTCLPYDHPQPPVEWSRGPRGRFVFVSPSNDLRFLGTLPLQSRHLKDYAPPGSLVRIVGLAVGFGPNFMSAIRAEGRLLLKNGSHRAYTLRRIGLTHAPCIVQHVASREELELVAPPVVRRRPDLYLTHPRPSLLRDYFDPALHTVIRTPRRLRQVTVSFRVEESYVPAL